MDLDGWELLPDDGLLEIHDDGGKKIFSRIYRGDHDPNSVLKMNYFICPSQNSPKAADPTYHEVVKEISKIPDTGAVETDDQDTVSQVFFKKMKENHEFVDMKVDSPKSSGRVTVPPIDAGIGEAMEGEGGSNMRGEKEGSERNSCLDSSDAKKEKEMNWEQREDGGVNLWKWSLNGLGAFCSFGVAAATICVIIFGSHNRNKQQLHSQKIRFQIYADEKRIKQVVHHATKLNEAISAVRGVPLTRAHFTCGGYYEGL